jgi:hypothetical protein
LSGLDFFMSGSSRSPGSTQDIWRNIAGQLPKHKKFIPQWPDGFERSMDSAKQ